MIYSRKPTRNPPLQVFGKIHKFVIYLHLIFVILYLKLIFFDFVLNFLSILSDLPLTRETDTQKS